MMNLRITLLRSILFLIASSLSQVSLSEWVDISPSVEISKSGRAFDRISRSLYSYVTVSNTSSSLIEGDLRLKIVNPTLQVTNSDGVAIDSSDYLLLMGESIPPGEQRNIRVNFTLARTPLDFDVKLEKEGFIIQTPAGDTYNPPSVERIIINAPAPYIDGSFIVWFTEGASRQQVEDIATGIDATIQGQSTNSDKYLFVISKRGLSFTDMQQVKDSLEQLPEVRLATVNYVINFDSSSSAVDVTPDSDKQYYIRGANIDKAWSHLKGLKKDIGGDAVWIGIADSILTNAHDDLKTIPIGSCWNSIGGVDVASCVYPIVNLSEPLEPHIIDLYKGTEAHGTFVTGIIAAEHNQSFISGVMETKKVLFISVILGEGSSSLYSFETALKRLVFEGAQIINISLGQSVISVNDASTNVSYCLYPRGYIGGVLSIIAQEYDVNQCAKFVESSGKFKPADINKWLWDNKPILYQEIIDYFNDFQKNSLMSFGELFNMGKDILVVQSAGNANSLAEAFSQGCSIPNTNILRSQIICVAALDEPLNDTAPHKLTDFSNYGSQVDISTYGQSIFSTNPYPVNITVAGTAYKNGTSFSAPIITGISGLIWNAYPLLTASDVKTILLEGSTETVTDTLGNSIRVADAYGALLRAQFYNNRLKIGGRDEMRIAGMDDGSFYIDDSGRLFSFGESIGVYYSYDNPLPKKVDINRKVVSVDASGVLAAALDEDGNVWTWGSAFQSNRSPRYPKKLSGLTGIRRIKHGGSDFFGIKNDGTLWFIGGSGIQQVNGISNVADTAGDTENLFVLKDDGTVWQFPTYLSGPPQKILDGITRIVELDTHGAFFAIKKDGTVLGWGNNMDVGLVNPSVPGPILLPTQISGLRNIIDIAAGYRHVLALRSDGTLWTWGDNSNGQLGHGDTMNRSIPSPIENLQDVLYVDAGERHSLVIKKDGTTWAWGAGEQGQLGNGIFHDSSIPVQFTTE